jgi:hypothetical protein
METEWNLPLGFKLFFKEGLKNGELALTAGPVSPVQGCHYPVVSSVASSNFSLWI